jgi:hypothetical protein
MLRKMEIPRIEIDNSELWDFTKNQKDYSNDINVS